MRAFWRARIAWRLWRRCAPWACASSARAPRMWRFTGSGLRGLRDAGRALDMGNAGHGHAPVYRTFGGAGLRFRIDRRRLAHEASDGARREAAARDGGRCAYPPRHAAGRDRRRARPARHRIPHAGGERAGEVGDSAGGAVCRHGHDRHCARDQPRPQRTHARKIAACASMRTACARRCIRRRNWRTSGSMCRAISPRPLFSSSRGCWAPRPRAC